MTKRSFASRAKKALKNIIHEHFPWALYHMNECGNVALYLKRRPEDGERLDPEDVIYPDGTAPKAGDPATCFSCKRQMGHEDFEPEYVRHV